MRVLRVLGSHGHMGLCPGTVLSALAWPGKGGAKERMILTAAGRLQAELAILMKSAGDGAGHRTLTQPCWGVT